MADNEHDLNKHDRPYDPHEEAHERRRYRQDGPGRKPYPQGNIGDENKPDELVWPKQYPDGWDSVNAANRDDSLPAHSGLWGPVQSDPGADIERFANALRTSRPAILPTTGFEPKVWIGSPDADPFDFDSGDWQELGTIVDTDNVQYTTQPPRDAFRKQTPEEDYVIGALAGGGKTIMATTALRYVPPSVDDMMHQWYLEERSYLGDLSVRMWLSALDLTIRDGHFRYRSVPNLERVKVTWTLFAYERPSLEQIHSWRCNPGSMFLALPRAEVALLARHKVRPTAESELLVEMLERGFVRPEERGQ